MSEENTIENIQLREKLLKQLEVEVGLPLTPKSSKELQKSFNGSEIVLDNYPIHEIHQLKINNTLINTDECIILENEGVIHLPGEYSGQLYIEYIYGIPKNEWEPLLDLMVEYESDNDWKKDASSVKEMNVSINFDTSLSKGAVIRDMITDLRNRYSCMVRMI